jgi:hypothetical protein
MRKDAADIEETRGGRDPQVGAVYEIKSNDEKRYVVETV